MIEQEAQSMALTKVTSNRTFVNVLLSHLFSNWIVRSIGKKHLGIVGFSLGLTFVLWHSQQYFYNYLIAVTVETNAFQDLTFDTIDDQNETFAVSAYKSQNDRAVRILILKKITANPLIYCVYVGNTEKTRGRLITNSFETFAIRGVKYGFLPLSERPGEYQAFVIYCKMPAELVEPITKGHVAIALHLGSSSYKAPVVLPIRPGLPETFPEKRGLPKVGLCFVPLTHRPQTDPAFLIELFELHRTVGVGLMLFYLGPNSNEGVRRVLDSYTMNASLGMDSKFQFRLVRWQVPKLSEQQFTPYHEQLLAQTDCLYRLARESEFVFHSNFDEMFVPKQDPNSKRITRWQNILKVLKTEEYVQRVVTCFPRRFFLMESNGPEITHFDRTRATEAVYSERRRCIFRSSAVHIIDLYWPIKPKSFNFLPSLGTVFDYGGCTDWETKPCEPGVTYVENLEMKPLLNVARIEKSRRLVEIAGHEIPPVTL